jgi:iron complex outermembrane receptor protein
MTLDLKAIWRPTGPAGNNEISFGFHRDEYSLVNPTYNAPDWQNSPDNGNGTYSTYGKGKTETNALWLQEAWKFAPGFKLTLGGRLEQWSASDGFDFAVAANGAVFQGAQPRQNATTFSPKVSLSWQFALEWTVTASYGQAHRFPTVAELYQIVSTGSTFAIPNPNLTPETANSGELAIQRETETCACDCHCFRRTSPMP